MLKLPAFFSTGRLGCLAMACKAAFACGTILDGGQKDKQFSTYGSKSCVTVWIAQFFHLVSTGVLDSKPLLCNIFVWRFDFLHVWHGWSYAGQVSLSCVTASIIPKIWDGLCIPFWLWCLLMIRGEYHLCAGWTVKVCRCNENAVLLFKPSPVLSDIPIKE